MGYIMHKGHASLGDLSDGFGAVIPAGMVGSVFYVNPGLSVSGNGSQRDPYNSVLTAFNQCRSGYNDTVVLIGQSSAWTAAATLTWDKDYCNLVGISSPLPGVGQRARIIGDTTGDLTKVINITGSGCTFANLQVYNGGDADADAGAVINAGNRNAFINCMFAGMGHATPAARAGSYSLSVTGAENHFRDCWIGLDTITRAAANSELLMSGSKNSFLHCTFASKSETAGKFAVTVSGAGYNEWEDCIFYNQSVNWAQALTNAFQVTASATHFIALRGQNQLIGYTGFGDVVTHMYTAAPVPAAGAGVSTQPTT